MAVTSSTALRLGGIVGAAMLAGAVLGGSAVAYQTHMFNALHGLQVARTQLALAVPDKAGYRVQAERLVDEAIGAVNSGIAAGAR